MPRGDGRGAPSRELANERRRRQEEVGGPRGEDTAEVMSEWAASESNR